MKRNMIVLMKSVVLSHYLIILFMSPSLRHAKKYGITNLLVSALRARCSETELVRHERYVGVQLQVYELPLRLGPTTADTSPVAANAHTDAVNCCRLPQEPVAGSVSSGLPSIRPLRTAVFW